MAPITSVPSRPRLMRPERSVMHSPKLTNRNGVETRMAPPRTASGTVHNPIPPSAMSGFSFQETDPPVERIACEYEDEDEPRQDMHGGVGQAKPALQQPAACADSTEQNGNRNHGKRILPRQERNEDSGEAIARSEIGIGSALHRGDLDHPRKTRRCTGQETDGHDQLADAKTYDFGGANIAAGNARGKTEHGVIDQDVGSGRGEDAEHQSPMNVGA